MPRGTEPATTSWDPVLPYLEVLRLQSRDHPSSRGDDGVQVDGIHRYVELDLLFSMRAGRDGSLLRGRGHGWAEEGQQGQQ